MQPRRWLLSVLSKAKQFERQLMSCNRASCTTAAGPESCDSRRIAAKQHASLPGRVNRHGFIRKCVWNAFPWALRMQQVMQLDARRGRWAALETRFRTPVRKRREKIKEATGRATDNQSLEAEGKADQASANIKQAGEKAKDAVKNTVD